MNTALLTLGRLPVALEIARALHAGGWRVVVAEPLAWHLCRTSRAVARCRTLTAPTDDPARYLDELLSIVDEEGVSLIVPVSEETMFVAGLHGRLPPGVRLACPPQASLLELHDKWRFAERARALGLAVPATALASSAAGERLVAGTAHVVKPRLSCSGVGVTLHERAASPEEAGRALGSLPRRDDLVVQTRLRGAPCCAFALTRRGALEHLVVYRSLLESGSVSVTFERVAAPDDVRRFVAAFVRGVDHEGMIAFDFIADESGRHHAIECNPRATSGIHFLMPGVLAAALLATERATGRAASGEPAIAPLGARRQEFWSALIEIEGALLRGRLDRTGWRRLFTTPDVNWSRRDPLPFLLMAISGLPLLWRALRARRPITEVTMLDMGWYGPAEREGETRVRAEGDPAGHPAPVGGRERRGPSG